MSNVTFHLNPIPEIVRELQHTILAADIATSYPYKQERWSTDHPIALDMAYHYMRAPESSRQNEAAGDALKIAWAVHRKLQALGWQGPSEIAKLKKKTKGLAIHAAKAKRAKK